MIDSARLGLPNFETGHVWLVGAGPGDPGLLSVLALHALGSADVVVYDALVDPRILRLARPGAVLDFAGKRGGRPSPSQPDISARLIRLAREGNRVLRLKGGDPCVFGRGGEEALALAAAGVPFRIVPGITAGIGGLAYAGIPLTHRDTNSAVTFLTGHDSDGSSAGRARLAGDRPRRAGARAVHGGAASAEHRRAADVGRTPLGGAGGRHQQGDDPRATRRGVDTGRGRDRGGWDRGALRSSSSARSSASTPRSTGWRRSKKILCSSSSPAEVGGPGGRRCVAWLPCSIK